MLTSHIFLTLTSHSEEGIRKLNWTEGSNCGKANGDDSGIGNFGNNLGIVRSLTDDLVK